jgi:hypothetical protein
LKITLKKEEKELVRTLVPKFIDVAVISTGKASHYNSEKEQKELLDKLHFELMNFDRGVYSILCAIDGVTDINKQLAVLNLLKTPYTNGTFVNQKEENNIIHFLSNTLPPQRMFKSFGLLKSNRINNKRVRKLIINSIVDSSKLEYWSVKYRKKLRKSLTHTWGRKNTLAAKSILSKGITPSIGNIKDKRFIKKLLFGERNNTVMECVSFILGNENDLTLPLLKSFAEAKVDFAKGSGLPYEVMEGIRSTYHKDTWKKEETLKTVKDNLTTTQKKNFQKKAAKEGVKIDFNPAMFSAVELYIYAFENGMTDDIKKALKKKAETAACNFMMNYENIGIVVDCSRSMFGDSTQKLRPISVGLSTRDMLIKSCSNYFIKYTGGKKAGSLLVKPEGDTTLADAILYMLEKEVDAVYVISDGYENVNGNRTNEVMKLVRKIGNNTPVFQFSPVTGAESFGTKNLSEEISTLPVRDPGKLGLTMLKSFFEADPEGALKHLYEETKRKVLKS